MTPVTAQPQEVPPLWRLVKQKIAQDDILLRASALAYSTLASLVPVFAIILAVLSGPAFHEARERVIDRLADALVPTQEGSGGWIVEPDSPQEQFKQTFRDTIAPLAEKAGTVSVFGFLLLVATAGVLFNTIEAAFNLIWRVGNTRPFFTRVAIATSMIFWGPVALAVSVSLTEYLKTLPIIGTYIAPALFTSLAFTAFLMLMPHSRVKLSSALMGGIFTAIIWEVTKLLFLVYVTQVVSYSRVYGALGVFPMLLLWLWLNWLVILSGAELAYIVQHRQAMTEQWLAAHEKEQAAAKKEPVHVPAAVTVAAAIELVRHFERPDAGPLTVKHLSDALKIEPGVARVALQRLVEGKMAAAIANHDAAEEDPAYLPLQEPARISVVKLLETARQEDNAATGDAPSLTRACALLKHIATLAEQQYQDWTLMDLANEGKKIGMKDEG